MEVRRLHPDEVTLYRALRFRMLADSPLAFGEPLSQAEARPDSYWAETVEHAATSPNHVTFVACDGEQVCGTVSGSIMLPPVLTGDQVSILRRAVAGNGPTSDEAVTLGPPWAALATTLAARHESDPGPDPDPRQLFRLLIQSGLNFSDVARIVPPPPPPDGRGGLPFGRPPNGGPPAVTCITAHVRGMWVDPTYRRRGVGRALLDALTAWAQEHHAERMELGVTEGNDPAIAFYERAGFKDTGRRIPSLPNPALRFCFMQRDLPKSDGLSG